MRLYSKRHKANIRSSIKHLPDKNVPVLCENDLWAFISPCNIDSGSSHKMNIAQHVIYDVFQ